MDDVSTEVTADVPLSPPKVVGDILDHATPTAETPGIRLRELTPVVAADIEAYEILDTGRQYPVVVLSPTPDKAYAISATSLRRLLVGIADILLIPAGTDTWAIKRSMSAIRPPHHGAALIVFPRWRSNSTDRVPTLLLRVNELTGSSGNSPEIEILRKITHRTNLPTSWRHISPAVVRDARLRDEMRRLRQELGTAVPQVAEYDKLLDQLAVEDRDLRDRMKILEGERDEYWQRTEETADELRELRYKYENLERALAAAKAAKPGGEAEFAEVRSLMASLLSREPTLVESLRLVDAMYGERLTILSTAWKSAEDHGTFKYKKEALELLHTLATGYWERLAQGEPDSTARSVFAPKNFAAKESATLTKEGRRARTFKVNGEPVFMEAHLKIQRGPNPAESLRLHFEWLPQERRLVIGHFGEHLPE